MRMLAALYFAIVMAITHGSAAEPGLEKVKSIDRRKPWPTFASMVAFSPDGATLAVEFGSVKLFDVKTGEHRAVLEKSHGLIANAFSADGKSIITGTSDGG